MPRIVVQPADSTVSRYVCPSHSIRSLPGSPPSPGAESARRMTCAPGSGLTPARLRWLSRMRRAIRRSERSPQPEAARQASDSERRAAPLFPNPHPPRRGKMLSSRAEKNFAEHAFFCLTLLAVDRIAGQLNNAGNGDTKKKKG